MKLHRRRVLAVLGVSSAAGLAGCPESGPTDNETEPSDSTDDEEEYEINETPYEDDSYSIYRFGQSVTVSDDGQTAFIGAPLDNNSNGEDAGSVYVFEQRGDEWRQETKLVANDGGREDNFGFGVAVSSDGGTAVIGAMSDDAQNEEEAGSAYVFERSDGDWHQTAKLVADDGDHDDKLGRSATVSSDGSTAIVGAIGDEDPNGQSDGYSGAGSAYVFGRSDGDWQQTAKLVADDGDENDEFGLSATVLDDGNTAIIGAHNTGPYVFERVDGSWREMSQLRVDGDPISPGFLSGDNQTVTVGTPDDSDQDGSDVGSAHIFERAGGSWQEVSKLRAEDGDEGDHFGRAVAVSHESGTAIIGAAHDEDPNGSLAGSAYVFEQVDESWRQAAKLVTAGGDDGGEFGSSVAISAGGRTAVIGAPFAEGTQGEVAGSAYVFERSDGRWRQAAKLTMS